MKSQQLLTKSTNSIFSGRRARRGLAAIFAAALVMGLGAGSAFAQGPYYPQVNPLGGGTFEPNGRSVFDDLELNAIEAKLAVLFPTKTLIIPAPTGKLAASAIEYAAAVKALATNVANGVAPAGVTLSNLAAEIAQFRGTEAGPALGALAGGIILSTSSTKAVDLANAGSGAAAANPDIIDSSNFTLFLNTIGANAPLSSALSNVVASILTGSVSTPLGASAVNPTKVKGLLTKAVAAGNLAPGLPAAVVGIRKALIENIASASVAAILASPALNRPANLDFATQALTIPSITVNLAAMVAKIKVATVGMTDIQAGAIAQGALRNTVNRNSPGYAAIKTGLGNNAYSDDLVDAFAGFSAAGSAGGLVSGVNAYDPAAVAAAGSLKFVASAGAIVKAVLHAANPGPGAAAQNIVARGAAAAQTQASAVAIATTNAAGGLGFGGATPADIVAGVITGADIENAGVVARAVASFSLNKTPFQAPLIAAAAIKAAAAAATAANKSDAYADIAFNIGFALKSGSALKDPERGLAVTAMVQEIVTAASAGSVAPTYIAVVGAMAGNGSLNAAYIRTTGLAADSALNANVNNGPITAGADLVTALFPFTMNELAAYAATTNALATPGTADRDRALLYAATLAHPSDVVGALAAVITKSALAPAATLTQDAISAARTKQENLALAGEVAGFIKTKVTAGLPTLDIQSYIGAKVLENPKFVADIATAGTVSIPKFSHFVAHAIAFNAPKQAWEAAAGILQHSLITATTGTAGVDRLAHGDRPAAVAAISAALTTGIVENRDLSPADKQFALINAVRSTVKALGPTYTEYNAQPGTAAALFRASNGAAGAGGVTTVPAKGVAGAVTGFVAQLVKSGDTAVSLDITKALTAISAAVGAAGFKLDIAQAAAQAFGWVSGQVASPSVAAAIATAVFAGYAPGYTLAQVRNAADFGLSEANGGVGPGAKPGAGAGGLRRTAGDPFYSHKSASGDPVSPILSL
jgi:hypothetical protein